METKLDKVRAYYGGFDEWGRLDSPEGIRELARALEVLTERLAPGARVLDLGGGPGRYTIERCLHRSLVATIFALHRARHIEPAQLLQRMVGDPITENIAP